MGLWLCLALAWAAPDPGVRAEVAEVVDADTLRLQDGRTVRLRYVDAPDLSEGEPLAAEAKATAAQFLGDGATITLLLSPTHADKHGRTVAGVLTEAGNLEIALLTAGHARLSVWAEDTDLRPYVAAQAEARAAGRGIWSHPDTPTGDLVLGQVQINAYGNDRRNPGGEFVELLNQSDQPLVLTGYRLTSLSGRHFPVPGLTLQPGQVLRVRSGRGKNELRADKGLVVYLGTRGAAWNNEAERIVLVDPHGQPVDRYDHGR